MKILNKYNQFLNLKPINENLDKSKKFLKQRYLTRKAAEELGFIKGELKAQLDHEEKRTVTLSDFTEEEQKEIKNKVRELRLTDEIDFEISGILFANVLNEIYLAGSNFIELNEIEFSLIRLLNSLKSFVLLRVFR